MTNEISNEISITDKIVLPRKKMLSGNKFPDIEDTNITIYKTYNLDLFQNHPLNRPEQSKKISELIESYKQQFFYIPSIVTQKSKQKQLYIVDGGNRYKALFEYNQMFKGSTEFPQLPFIFIIYDEDKITINDVRRINLCTSNWKLEDYCISFLKEGREAFLKLNAFRQKYPKIPLTVLIGAISGQNAMSRVVFSAIKQGQLQIIDEENATQTCDRLTDLSLLSQKFTINKTAWFATLRLVTLNVYEHDYFVKRITNNPNLLSKLGYHDKLVDYGSDFDYIYNYRKSNPTDIVRQFQPNYMKQKRNV